MDVQEKKQTLRRLLKERGKGSLTALAAFVPITYGGAQKWVAAGTAWVRPRDEPKVWAFFDKELRDGSLIRRVGNDNQQGRQAPCLDREAIIKIVLEMKGQLLKLEEELTPDELDDTNGQDSGGIKDG